MESKIISDFDKLKLLNWEELSKIHKYEETVDVKEYKQLLAVEKQSEVQKVRENLERDYLNFKQDLTSRNEELLDLLESKNKELLLRLEEELQGFVQEVNKLLGLEETRIGFIISSLKKKLQSFNIMGEHSIEANNVKIKLTNNDYELAKAELGREERALDKWLIKLLIIDHSLNDGLAIIETPYIKCFISFDKVKEIIKQKIKVLA